MKACSQYQKKPSGDIKTAGASWPVPTGLQGKCEGEPLDVSTPSGRDVDENETCRNWVKVRLRELWPLEPRHELDKRTPNDPWIVLVHRDIKPYLREARDQLGDGGRADRSCS